MYSRYDPTAHDTFLPVGREAKTVEFPVGAPLPDARPDASDAAMGVGSDGMSGMQGAAHDASMMTQSAAAAAMGGLGASASATAAAPRGGLLDSLRGLFGGSSSRGLLGDLDLGDIILLLIVALLFLEGGSESDLIILLAVALFIGF